MTDTHHIIDCSKKPDHMSSFNIGVLQSQYQELSRGLIILCKLYALPKRKYWRFVVADDIWLLYKNDINVATKLAPITFSFFVCLLLFSRAVNYYIVRYYSIPFSRPCALE